MAITAVEIKELREATGAGVMDCKEALQKADGDMKEAMGYLREKGLAKAAKRASRSASDGIVELYSHGGGRVGVIVEVNCETDFVARSDGFKKFAHEVALQIAAMEPVAVKEDDLDEELIQRIRGEAIEKAKEDGKPEKILDRIADGYVEKYKKEKVLLNQVYIRDDDLTIQDLLNQSIGTMGENIIIRRFQRWELGELVMEETSEE